MRPYWVSDEKAWIGELNFLLEYILLTGASGLGHQKPPVTSCKLVLIKKKKKKHNVLWLQVTLLRSTQI